MRKILSAVGSYAAAVAVVGALIGAAFQVESRYAKEDTVSDGLEQLESALTTAQQVLSERLVQVDDRLERKINEDRLEALEKRLWNREDYWGGKYKEANGRSHDTLEQLIAWSPPEAREEFRRLLRQIAKLRAELGLDAD